MTPASSPQNARAKANTPSIDAIAKTQIPCDSVDAGSPVSDRKEPYSAGTPGSSRNGAQHPERVGDQELAVRRDLVAVEQVLRPVVAGDGLAADHALLEDRAERERALARRRPSRAAGRPGRLGPREGRADRDDRGECVS